MAKFLLVLLAMCIVPSIAARHHRGNRLVLHGCVYCDTCRCGYQTSASTPVSGAVVRVECRNRVSGKITYTKEAVTNSTGDCEIPVDIDCGDDYCDSVLVKSSDPECSTPDLGRDRARVILTSDNGMASNTRYANPMGFVKKTPLEGCSEILKQYEEQDAED